MRRLGILSFVSEVICSQMSQRTQPKDEDTGGDSFASSCVTIVEVFRRVDRKLPKPQAHIISRNPKRLKIPNKTRNPSSNRACFGPWVLLFRASNWVCLFTATF